MRPVVVKISGSLVSPESIDYLRGLVGLIRRAAECRRLVLVTGGGKVARSYIQALKALGAGQGLQDMAGIEASRLNARLVAYSLYPLAAPEPPEGPRQLLELAAQYRVVVTGGFQPGQSTNAVALVAAELVGAGLVVNLLNGVGGVYRRFPPGPGEEPERCMSLSSLWEIVSRYEQEAGSYKLIDHIAVGIARRSRVPILFADGSSLATVEAILLRGEPRGTLVVPDGSECPESLE